MVVVKLTVVEPTMIELAVIRSRDPMQPLPDQRDQRKYADREASNRIGCGSEHALRPESARSATSAVSTNSLQNYRTPENLSMVRSPSKLPRQRVRRTCDSAGGQASKLRLTPKRVRLPIELGRRIKSNCLAGLRHFE